MPSLPAVLLGLGACGPAGDARDSPPPVERQTAVAAAPRRLAAHPNDPHYFSGLDGRPVFLLGFYDGYGWWKRPSFRAALKSSYTSNKLTYIRLTLPLSGGGHAIEVFPYRRTGPGNANDGGPRFDLTLLDPAFFQSLAELVDWAEANRIYVQVSLLNGIAFKLRSDLAAWPGSVFNPENRISALAADLGPRGDRPTMYDLFDRDAGWASDADRAWLRDRVKALVDKVLQVLAPYHNWWIEIGNENEGESAWKEYWIHYARGTPHTIDDGAVSPYANPGRLVGDNSDFGGDVVLRGLVDSQQRHHVTEVTAAIAADAMYSDGRVGITDTDGAPRAYSDRRQNRRAAWITLTHGGHFNNYSESADPASLGFLADFRRLREFLTRERTAGTIEHLLPFLRPDPAVVTGGHALRGRPDQGERYLVFAPASVNPTLHGVTAGLSILRYDTETGIEEAVGSTVAGSNTLAGTGRDTAWWIQ